MESAALDNIAAFAFFRECWSLSKSTHRRFTLRAAGTALSLLFVAFALPAATMTISAPAGGVVASGSPFYVQWVSTPGPGTMRIDLTSSSHDYYLANGVPNTGQALVSFPANAVCNPQEVFRMRVLRQVPIANGTSYPDQGYGPPFTFACPVTVIKQVVNTTGRRVLGSAFRVRVQCEPGSQTFGNIQAPSTGSFTQKVHVPPGSTWCTVQEVSMPSPAVGCAWLTTYPGGQQTTPGGAPVTIVNTLQCGPLPPPPGPR